MLECSLMGFFEEPSLAEGHAELNPMCLGEVIFSADVLTKEPTAANEAAFLVSEKASHAEIIKSLEERASVDGGPDRYLDQVQELHVKKEASDDINLTVEFLGGLQNFVTNFRQKHALN